MNIGKGNKYSTQNKYRLSRTIRTQTSRYINIHRQTYTQRHTNTNMQTQTHTEQRKKTKSSSRLVHFLKNTLTIGLVPLSSILGPEGLISSKVTNKTDGRIETHELPGPRLPFPHLSPNSLEDLSEYNYGATLQIGPAGPHRLRCVWIFLLSHLR